MNIQEMNNVSSTLGVAQSAISSVNGGSYQSMTATAGGLIGAGVGSAFGSPMAGYMIGSAAGSVVGAMIPTHSTTHASIAGLNFVKFNQKPYGIMLAKPSRQCLQNLSDYYCYYGCATSRTEKVDFSAYRYKDHAFIAGTPHLKNVIPAKYEAVFNGILQRGIHVLYV